MWAKLIGDQKSKVKQRLTKFVLKLFHRSCRATRSSRDEFVTRALWYKNGLYQWIDEGDK